jgi:hypothetical protein
MRPSLLYAGIEIARQSKLYGRSHADAVQHLSQGVADVARLDYTGALAIIDQHGIDLFSSNVDPTLSMRETIERWLIVFRPMWRDLAPRGRQAVLDALDPNILSCLEIASLTASDQAVLDWWDRVAAEARAEINARRLAHGREAEKRSMDRETVFLAGTGLNPAWVSIEDNSAGFDIQTFRQSSETGLWEEHYIEVKSALIDIHLSFGEWRFADAHPSCWELHIWPRQTDEPIVLGVAQVRSHIPAGQGAGIWESVIIPLRVFAGGDDNVSPTGPENLTEPLSHKESSDRMRTSA